MCTFEVLLEEFNLHEDAALVRLAKIVHAADIDSDRGTDPFADAICAMAAGGLALFAGSAVGQQKALKDQLVGTWTYVFKHQHPSRWH